MQKIATKVFVGASVAFAIIGLLMVVTTSPTSDGPNVILLKLFFTSIIIILTSFALSVANKYLSSDHNSQ